ncbi:MAG: tRNA epoxyqueuosine(34) reductase QueG [Candidatus Neomarinimicrobiota bacterium]|nr:tRNA epoxyqueuosine(34) reductase QueG [Candidatus Neomarinimicrobiota bacterium]MED5256889.1 tRNA epoxyqueuosine(34) reductase QueG [Candidatus Neomarinimicrobiota bacterium]
MTNSFTQYIKEKAKDIGFEKIGITQAVSTDEERIQLEDWLKNKHHGTMNWIEKRKDERGSIFNYFTEVKSVISVGLNYYSGHDQNDLKSNYKFSNYAWGDDYHHIIKSKLYELMKHIKDEYPDIKAIACVDTSPIMEKLWAQKSGIGWQGKHTNLITRDYGSWLFLGEILVDIELEYDNEFIEDLCGSCTACIDSCPTHALDEYQIYADKCISYFTIEHKGEFPSNTELDNWIYGCDICQEVCPWNQKFSQITNEKKFYPKEEILFWTDKDWESISTDEFRKIFKGSAVKRTKHAGLLRNINTNK